MAAPALMTYSPTFITFLEDLEREKARSSSPMITESEATRASALFPSSNSYTAAAALMTYSPTFIAFLEDLEREKARSSSPMITESEATRASTLFPNSNPCAAAATLMTYSPTFISFLEDLERANARSSSPMVAESSATRASALFPPNSNSHAVDSDVAMSLSPLLDTDPGISNMINIEGASWAVEFTDIGYSSESVPPMLLSESNSTHIGIPSVNDRFNRLLGLPGIYHALCEVKATFWAGVSLDIRHYVWAKMSQKLRGREPTKTLFTKIYNKATTRQMAISSAPWKAVKVTLEVPRIANVEVKRDAMVENVLQTKQLLHYVEAEVVTSHTNTKFMLALMLTFTAAWVRYRSFCYEKAGLVVLPHADLEGHLGLLPHPQDFTPEFRSKLQALMNDHSRGSGLLHEHPSLSGSTNSSDARPFTWFGNSILKEVIQRALYDPTHPGWFGYLEDVRTTGGRRVWAPLEAASTRQVGQVLGWVEELLNFHIVQANKARPFVAYAQLPDHFTSHDSVIKRASRHAKSLAFLGGGSGELPDPSDPLAWLADNTEEMEISTEKYMEFSKRATYVPYAASVAEYC